jgi:hypothetical protein
LVSCSKPSGQATLEPFVPELDKLLATSLFVSPQLYDQLLIMAGEHRI